MTIAYEAELRRLHAIGYTDSEIAKVVGRCRERVGKNRRRLGLPSNRYGDRCRGRIQANTAKQLLAAGLPNLCALKQQAHRKFALRNGWPEDLNARQVTILNALLERGPLTKRQICEAVGVPWRGVDGSLRSHYGVSYLSVLQRRGLVVSLGRVIKSMDSKSASVCLYSLPVAVEPLPVSERMHA